MAPGILAHLASVVGWLLVLETVVTRKTAQAVAGLSTIAPDQRLPACVSAGPACCVGVGMLAAVSRHWQREVMGSQRLQWKKTIQAEVHPP